MIRLLFKLCLSLLLALSASNALSQGFSADGNRWYEIEVSVFLNPQVPGQEGEKMSPGRVNLQYPSRLRDLTPASFAFHPGEMPPPAPAFMSTALALEGQDNEEAEEVLYGPRLPSTSGPRFRMPDYAADPYIALSPRFHKFTTINRRLASRHRILFHAVWRQPVPTRDQASAVFIRGGERRGEHNELEGSITASFNVNRVDMELKLWLSRFSAGQQAQQDWRLPPQPFPVVPDFGRGALSGALAGEDSIAFTVTEVAVLEELRQMTSNTLHYLDHPAFGVVIEIRPYQLPNPFAEDF